MAEARGFEPLVLLRAHAISSRARSATPARLQIAPHYTRKEKLLGVVRLTKQAGSVIIPQGETFDWSVHRKRRDE